MLRLVELSAVQLRQVPTNDGRIQESQFETMLPQPAPAKLDVSSEEDLRKFDDFLEPLKEEGSTDVPEEG